jgi:hypothetical protein
LRAVLLAALLTIPAGAGAQELPEAPGWTRIGSFRGAPADDFSDAFENEVFREARTGDLFQELGDVEIGLGGSWQRARIDATLAFSRRVLMRQADLPDESEVGDDATSGFRAVNQATAKTELPVSYLSEHATPFHVGLRATSGFVFSVAETQPPRPLPDHLAVPRHAANLRDEISGYWHSRDVRFKRQILPRIGHTIVTLVDSLSALLERNFEDTERGAVFFEGMVEPLTLQADLGFPMQPALFSAADRRLAPGDGATYTVFAGLSPLEAGVQIAAARSSLEYFLRLNRETTVVKLPNDKVLVRTRTVVSRGADLTLLKVRPEIRLLLLRYGYTFFSDRWLRSDFRTTEVVYRFDLAEPAGRDAFAAFLGADQRMRLRPALDAAARRNGVEILLASTRDGRRQDASRLARFPSWFRFKTQDLSFDQHLGIGGIDLLQATRGSSRSLNNSWPRSNHADSSVIEMQAPPAKPGAEPGQRACEVRSGYRNRAGDAEASRRFARLLQALPGSPVDPGILSRLTGAVSTRGLLATIRVGIRGAAFERFLELDEGSLWRAAAFTILGPERSEEWQTAAQRGAFQKAAGRQGRRDLREATRFVERCARMRGRLAAARVARPDWFRGHAAAAEIVLLQQAMLAAAQEAGEKPYYRIELWADGRPRPWTWSSGRSPLYRPAGWTLSGETTSALLPGVADISGLLPGGIGGALADDTRSSDPRLLAGTLYRSDDAADGAPPTYRLSLFSNLRFQPGQRLRVEVRRSRIRSDIPLDFRTVPLGAPAPVPPGPFAVSLLRYDVELPVGLITALPGKTSYSLSLRVVNAAALPLTEQQLLRFKLP